VTVVVVVVVEVVVVEVVEVVVVEVVVVEVVVVVVVKAQGAWPSISHTAKRRLEQTASFQLPT